MAASAEKRTFVMRVGEDLFLVTQAWEYRADGRGLTEGQREGYGELKKLFDGGDPVEARSVSHQRASVFTGHWPHPPFGLFGFDDDSDDT